jgi:SdrD B-like domain
MSPNERPRLNLESLDERLVPAAAILDLTTAASVATTPSGAIFEQATTPLFNGQTGTGSVRTFLRINNPGIEQGYNTTGNLQLDTQSAKALTLSRVPVVYQDGVPYREFLLGINEQRKTALLSLDELRVFLGSTSNLTGYNTNTKRLGGVNASFDMDSGGDVAVLLNANLNRRNGVVDAIVLIPDAAFTGADPNSFVYLYSKFGGAAAADGGDEVWFTRRIAEPPPSPPPPPPPATGSLSGFTFADADRNGVWDQGEMGIAGETITLQGFDSNNNPVSLETQTLADGSFSFTNVPVGNYTLAEQPLFGYGSEFATAGTEGGNASAGQIANISLLAGHNGVGYLFGDVFTE